jgi:hypothetical protein
MTTSSSMDEGQRQRQIIEAWMLSNVRTGGFNRYDDLHIDRIDERWRHRKNWIDGGLEALRLGVELRDKHQLEFTVALGCSLLVSGSSPLGLPRRSEDLASQLDSSPPSLYLFPKRQEPWLESGGTEILEELGESVSKSRSAKAPQFYYLEFTQDGAKHRSVFITL